MVESTYIGDQWFSASELAGLPELPGTERNVREKAAREKWEYRERSGRGGGREYSLKSIPDVARIALELRAAPPVSPVHPLVLEPGYKRGHGMLRHVSEEEIKAAWVYYETLTDTRRVAAKRRWEALCAVHVLTDAGIPLMQARAQVAAQRAGERGLCAHNLARFQEQVGDAPRSAWLALLADRYKGGSGRPGEMRAACDPVCFEWYKSFYLSRNRPTHAETYRRLMEMVRAQGWTVPSAHTMKRRLNREVPRAVQMLAREGEVALRRLLPVQPRDVTCFAPGEAVNGDGLKLDRMWIAFEDGERLKTGTVWFWQDIYSRRFLAWRLDKTENTDVFRLATYDLTAVCAPQQAWMDNTRAAANKVMTAGAQGRHRFTSDPEDGQGLLALLGIEPRFTNPDKWTGNPGAKPIERAFGIGGIHGAIVNNPKITAAGGGRSKEAALPVALVREVIAEEVARFNARPQRRTEICKGELSFDQAWAQGREGHVPRVLTGEQRRVLLMSREVVRASADRGQVWIKAGRGPYGRNSYWTEALAQWAGEKVVVLFDPENLRADAHVYTLDGELICTAEHVPGAAFNSARAGREHAKFKRRAAKSHKSAQDSLGRMDALERAQLYAAALDTGDAPEPVAGTGMTDADGKNVVRGHFGKTPVGGGRAVQVDQEREADSGDVIAFDPEFRKRLEEATDAILRERMASAL